MNIAKIDNFTKCNTKVDKVTFLTDDGDNKYSIVKDGTIPISSTIAEPIVECNITPIETGNLSIRPAPGFTSIQGVDINYSVPKENKVVTITENNFETVIEPSNNKLLEMVSVCTDIPTESKDCTFTENGSYTINPSTGNLISDATVCVKLPIQDEVCVILDRNKTCEINPTGGNVALSKVTVTADIGSEEVTCNITCNGSYTINPSMPGNFITCANVNVNVVPTLNPVEFCCQLGPNESAIHIPIDNPTVTGNYVCLVEVTASNNKVAKELCITENGTCIVLPDSPNQSFCKVTINTSVNETKPEETFDCCFTTSGYYSITPSAGNVFTCGNVCVDIPEYLCYIEMMSDTKIFLIFSTRLDEILALECKSEVLENPIYIFGVPMFNDVAPIISRYGYGCIFERDLDGQYRISFPYETLDFCINYPEYSCLRISCI